MQVTSNGIKIECQLSGPEDAPVVAMSHSLASSSVMWDQQSAALEAHFRVVRLDTRGHGGSDAPAMAYSLDMLGDDLLGALDALGVGRFHWVGLSMGGMIGQNLALRAPGRIDRLVLCDTSSRLPPEAGAMWDQRIANAERNGMAVLLEETIARWFTPPFLRENPPVLATIRQQLLDTPVAGYAGCCQAIKGLDYLERLAEISHPTLVLVGEDDPGTDVATAQTIQAGIAGARLAILPSASHLSNVEQPAAFNDAVVGFLTG
jgi:3-oxoadipate enol-lactonase